MPRASATSSRGWIAWRAPSEAALNQWADDDHTRNRMTEQGVRGPGAVALMVALAIVSGDAQQAPLQPRRAPGVLSEGVRAVLVDVVVRDKHGQPVRDLEPSDFEVLEDGVPQTIGSFTPVFAGAGEPPPPPPASPAPAAAAGASNPLAGSSPSVNTGPTVTALVFDRLTPEARRLAVKAAQGYLGTKEEAPGYIGIFGVDLALTPYAPFTRNAYVLRQALDRMSSRASSSFNSPEQRQQKTNADREAASAAQAVASGASVSGPGASDAMGTAGAALQMAQMQSKMIQDFDVMERDQQGYSTTNGLFAIINTLRRLPGRKSLVLFSEGIALPPAVQRLFLGVIDAANRANVSIYTMDAAGLRGESEQAKIRDQVNQAAGTGTGILGSRGSGGDPLTKALEKNEDVLRQDPHNALGELAHDTGGLLFESTNNLRQGFDRIESDLHNYYLVGYTPANDAYDGRFRTIEVKVKRPGVTVAARKGYFAVRDSGDMSINSWEAPALGALEQKPVPNAFPVRAGAMLFPERGRSGLVAVAVDLKTALLTFQTAADGKTYSSDFAVLVRFLDQQNQVTRKVSQHYEIKGPLSALERAKQGEVIFYREPELPAGLYTMETVVYDAPSGQSSVRLSTVEVPKADDGKLRMSSLVLVKRGETVPEKDRRANNPLLVKDVMLYPNLGEPVSKESKELGFYFAAYPVHGGPAPESVIQLLQDGKPVAQLPMPLASADASGRVQQVGRLPLAELAAGTYELRAVVTQGSERVFGSSMLRIVD
jgi:VWFA-related protein